MLSYLLLPLHYYIPIGLLFRFHSSFCLDSAVAFGGVHLIETYYHHFKTEFISLLLPFSHIHSPFSALREMKQCQLTAKMAMKGRGKWRWVGESLRQKWRENWEPQMCRYDLCPSTILCRPKTGSSIFRWALMSTSSIQSSSEVLPSVFFFSISCLLSGFPSLSSFIFSTPLTVSVVMHTHLSAVHISIFMCLYVLYCRKGVTEEKE